MPRMKSPKVKGSPSSNRSRPESTHHQRRPTKLLRYYRNCLAHATKYCSFRRPFLQHNTIFHHHIRQPWCNSYISTVGTVVIVHLHILSHMLTNNHPVTQQDQSVHHCAPLNCRICLVNTVGIWSHDSCTSDIINLYHPRIMQWHFVKIHCIYWDILNNIKQAYGPHKT